MAAMDSVFHPRDACLYLYFRPEGARVCEGRYQNAVDACYTRFAFFYRGLTIETVVLPLISRHSVCCQTAGEVRINYFVHSHNSSTCVDGLSGEFEL